MDRSLAEYANNLRKPQAAESYSTKYQRIWHKRMSDSREREVIQQALAMTGGPHTDVMDMPCGAGRLTDELLTQAQTVYACDYSEEQLKICRSRHPRDRVSTQRVNCFQLPFEDRRFDLCFSVRLSHHIGDRTDRERYLRELMRVSDGHVVATFFDTASLKNRFRELRRRFLFLSKRSKYTMAVTDLRKIAEEEGFELRGAIPISRVFSGHIYCVFKRVR